MYKKIKLVVLYVIYRWEYLLVSLQSQIIFLPQNFSKSHTLNPIIYFTDPQHCCDNFIYLAI